MSNLLARLDAELYRVSREAREKERDGRGLLSLKSGLENVDIYAHPSAIMAFRRELEPMTMFRVDNPKKMPRDAVGKYRDCWIFADAHQPEGALIIRLNGYVFADVPIGPDKARSEDE